MLAPRRRYRYVGGLGLEVALAIGVAQGRQRLDVHCLRRR